MEIRLTRFLFSLIAGFELTNILVDFGIAVVVQVEVEPFGDFPRVPSVEVLGPFALRQ